MTSPEQLVSGFDKDVRELISTAKSVRATFRNESSNINRIDEYTYAHLGREWTAFLQTYDNSIRLSHDSATKTGVMIKQYIDLHEEAGDPETIEDMIQELGHLLTRLNKDEAAVNQTPAFEDLKKQATGFRGRTEAIVTSKNRQITDDYETARKEVTAMESELHELNKKAAAAHEGRNMRNPSSVVSSLFSGKKDDKPATGVTAREAEAAKQKAAKAAVDKAKGEALNTSKNPQNVRTGLGDEGYDQRIASLQKQLSAVRSKLAKALSAKQACDAVNTNTVITSIMTVSSQLDTIIQKQVVVHRVWKMLQKEVNGYLEAFIQARSGTEKSKQNLQSYIRMASLTAGTFKNLASTLDSYAKTYV